MNNIKLSLTPLNEAVWETEPETGAEFEIVPLSGGDDESMQQKHRNMMGTLDLPAFAADAGPRIIRNWRGVGDKQTPVACSPENVQRLCQVHLRTVFLWALQRARSLEHFRIREIDAAKNG